MSKVALPNVLENLHAGLSFLRLEGFTSPRSHIDLN